MAQRVTWSEAANADLRKLVKYLRTHTNEEYATRIARGYVAEIGRIADHPTKGMLIDNRRGLRRWKLDRHNYVTYTIQLDGIVVKNILAYKLNKRGF